MLNLIAVSIYLLLAITSNAFLIVQKSASPATSFLNGAENIQTSKFLAFHLKKRDIDDSNGNKSNYYESDFLEKTFQFIERSSLPLLPYTRPISILYPLSLSGLSLVLPLYTSLLLDFGFIFFLYLARTLAIDEDDKQGETLEFMTDFAAFGAAVASAGLLSPQGLGEGSSLGSGGLVGLGVLAILAALSSVVSAIIGSNNVGNSSLSTSEHKEEDATNNRETNDGDGGFEQRLLQLWDEKLNSENKNSE